MNHFRLFLNEYSLSDLRVPTIDIIDIIDIVIVAFFIYAIVVWIKETRAWSLFKGVIVILLFSVFAIVFNLNTILFILKNAISVGIIAIIVVFQPELRKALQELGSGHFLSPMFSGDNENLEKLSIKTIEEILEAVSKMSAKKTGALILIEQEVPLGDHERTGIIIDGIVSSQLILSIFEYNTPLHDGAVIIKNNKVSAASCFLPLTDSSEVSMELGTRHRAALGASEVSDAYIIVVSEETGAVSVVKDGTINRDVKINDIREALLVKSSMKKRFFRKGKNQ